MNHEFTVYRPIVVIDPGLSKRLHVTTYNARPFTGAISKSEILEAKEFK